MVLEQKIDELLKDNRRNEAIALLEKCLIDEPENQEILLRLGELIYAEGKMTEALNKFNALLRLNPEHQKAQNYVTMINSILGYYCKDLLNP
jgi:tetratricopeptide (TPR) repeat protein